MRNTASQYDVEFISYEPIEHGKHGYRVRITWKAADGTVKSANTHGGSQASSVVSAYAAGARVNLIRNGNGAIIHIHRPGTPMTA